MNNAPIQSDIYVDIDESEFYVKRIGQGKAVFFLHGGPGSEHSFFLPHMIPLAEHFELVFYDQRGCGKSASSTNNVYSMEDEVNTLELLREKLGFNKICLFGESWGSMLALLYASAYPDRVEKVFLTAAIGLTSEGLKVFESELNKRLSEEDQQELSRLEKGLEDGTKSMADMLNILDPYYVYNKENLAKKQNALIVKEVNDSICKDMLAYYDLTSKISILFDIPILVAQGQYDIVTPSLIQKLLVNHIPNIELITVKDAGHWTVIERPDEMIRFAKEFFSCR